MSAVNPFLTVTTPAMERAKRLLSVRTHPGFLEIVRISQEIVQTATDQLVEYEGWDKDQIAVLKARAQAAKEHHMLLLARIQSAIEEGEAEARALIEENAIPVKTAQEVVEESDELRARVLRKITEQESRPAGSY